MSDTPEFLTQADLARVIGVTTRAVRQWEEDPTFPQKGPDGLYDAQAVVAWRSERQMDSETRGARLKIKDHKEFHSARKEKALADWHEFRLKILQGEFIRRHEHEQRMLALLVAFGNTLERCPHELAAKLSDRSEEFIRTALAQWQATIRTALMDELEKGLEISEETIRETAKGLEPAEPPTDVATPA